MNKSPNGCSSEKEKLLELEGTGEYVFHGTAEDVETLEPKQAIDTKRGPDGSPAVFATNIADYAIFMAILNKKNCPQGSQSSAGTENGQLSFGATKETLAQLQPSASGYVYVFPRSAFILRDEGGVEYVSETKVQPVMKIKVSMQDLPEKIEIFE